MTATSRKNKTAMRVAEQAAVEAFDAYLLASKATATQYVPTIVVSAANLAYRSAGGTGEISVVGRGNRTHPVCSVSVVKV